MNPSISCPSPEKLKHLLDGVLPQDQQAALHEHLDSCAACQKSLESMVAGKESWSEAALHLGQENQEKEAGLERVVKVMQSDPGQTVTHGDSMAREEFSLDFLSPSEKPGHLGRLDHYEIMKVVGRGGFGVVLKAFDEKLHRVVAIKVLGSELAGNATARRRFNREAKAAAAVVHEHVVTIHAVEEDRKPPYLVMQFVEGMSLQDKLDKIGPLGVKEILRIGMQAASGLAAAHKQGLVHRDIKPANILLENGVERVKITDFGLARAVDDASLSQSGVVAGTPQYMAPEQAKAEAVDQRADLFSLGSVLYALCTGHAPFRASTSLAVLKRVCDDAPRPIREINPEIPDWMVAIIDKLHAKNPADRFQSATEVAELLGQHLAHLQQPGQVPKPARVIPGESGGQSAIPIKVRQRTAPSLVRWKWAAGLLALVATLAGAGAFFRSQIIRTLEGRGAIVFDFKDPELSIFVDDEPVIDSGIGPREIEVRPGTHRVRAEKDGSAIYFGVLTVERGQRYDVAIPHTAAAQSDDTLGTPIGDTRLIKVQDQIGKSFHFSVTGTLGGPAWGTDVYTTDSLLEAVAVHAGILKAGETGVVKATIVDPPPAFTGSSRHGITTGSWGWFPGAFRVDKADAGAKVEEDGDGATYPYLGGRATFVALQKLQHQVGKSFRFKIMGKTIGPVWGTDVYTTDSSLSTAAVHAGVLKDGETSVVKVTFAPPPARFQGSERHGVTSGDWGAFPGAFQVARAEGQAPAPKSDKDLLQGAWLAESAEAEVHTLERDMVDKGLMRIAFKGNTMEVPIIGTEKAEQRAFALNPGQNPKHIDVTREKDLKTIRGIYRLDADRLMICMSSPEDPRPTEFKPTKGTRQMLVRFRRPSPSEDDWVQLFNGKDLTGWKPHPDQPGAWKVDNGILVGSGPQPMSHLFSERGDFKDFHLRVESKINFKGNSGFYFRTPFHIPRARGFPTGYEAEINVGEKDVNKTGSLWNLKPYRQIPPGADADEWFTMEIITKGKRMTIKVNGLTTVEDFEDNSFTQGHLALQQAGADTVVHFRKIEIKELPTPTPPAERWIQLFNGKDLTGWKYHPTQPGEWKVENGLLISGGKKNHLFSERGDFENFHLRADVEINAAGNSGIFFRNDFGLNLRYGAMKQFTGTYPAGYEAQILGFKDAECTGSLYNFKAVAEPPVPAGQRFTLEIIADDNRTIIKVDGKPTVDFVDPNWTYRRGHFALQHMGPETVVQFPKIEVKELPKTQVTGPTWKHLFKSGDLTKKEHVLKQFGPMDRPITQNGVGADQGGWFIKGKMQTVHLYEVANQGLDDCAVLCRSQIKTQDLNKPAYLELSLKYPGRAEGSERPYARKLIAPSAGATEWSLYETPPWTLTKGDVPEAFQIKLVFQGEGNIWIKDVELVARRAEDADKEGWTPLFNGKDLTGWVPRVQDNQPPERAWEILEGILISRGSPNGYLRTEKVYENFILEMECQASQPFSVEKPAWAGDLLLQIPDPDPGFKAITGLRLQILPGGEGSLGPMGLPNPVPGTVIDWRDFQKGWNKLRIESKGGKLGLFLNGKALITADYAPKKGYFGIMSVASGMRYRNIMIKELAAAK